jgi:hypothetical protein
VVSVPRAWPGETVTVIATGPSLTQDDVDLVRGKTRVIAINDAYKLAPWADCLYATDAKWWHWHKGVPSFTGPKWSLEHSQWRIIGRSVLYPDVQRLRNTGHNGLEHDPTGLRNGRNSGYAALNLAYHYGAQRILLLGYDMQKRGGKSHFFGEHPNGQQSPYPQFRQIFTTLVKPFAKAGVEVINCSRNSVLSAFPKAELRQALAALEVAA